MKFFIYLTKPENQQMKELIKKARKKFFVNIVLPSILAVILFVVTLFFIVLPHFENSMLDRKREMITELTNTATSILEKYHKDELAGLITRKEAQQTAISRIEYLRYGDENKDYFWVTDMQPVMIVHPYRPELNGTDLSDFEDSHGKKLFEECVKVVEENGQGYVEYMWQWKDDPSHIVPKLSYVKLFKPWGWIVGTGIYIEDVKTEIDGLTNRFIIISLIITALVSLILFWVGRQSFKIEIKRIQAEAELNKSREKYRSLVDASTEGLLMVIDNKITFANPVFEKMSGYDNNAILDKNIEEIVDLPDTIREKLNGRVNKVHQKTSECQLNLDSGEKLDVVLNVNNFDFYGQDAIIFSFKDVSSDKLVQEELLSSREKFQTLMDKLNQGIFRTSIDTKGKFLEANQTAINIFGYDAFSQIKNMYILDFFVEKHDKLTFRKNLLKHGFINNQFIKLRKKSGEHIHVAVSVIVIYEKGEPKFCEGIIQDISTNNEFTKDDFQINKEFATFMHHLLTPIAHFSKDVLTCPYNGTINSLISEMNLKSVDYALVQAENDVVIGYVDESILRKRCLISKDMDLQIYSIMSSPVNYIDENFSILNLLNYFAVNKDVNYVVLRSIDGEIKGFIDKRDLVGLEEFLPLKVVNSIQAAGSVVELKALHEKFVSSVLPLVSTGADSELLFGSLSFISDLICKRLIKIGIEKIGAPPVEFCFVTLGSEGRQEQTLNTDQDNAIIFDDTDEETDQKAKDYFDKLAEFVCDALDEVGYEHCKGGIMAKNSEYCQAYSVWERYFTKWINTGTGKDLLDISVFFDMRAVYGKESFVSDLKNRIDQLTENNPAYLVLLAQNNIKLKPQVGFWGNILLETAGAPPETVNIKETIMPIVNFARIYALKHEVHEVSTIKRLQTLKEEDILSISSYQNIIQAYKYLQGMRLKQQSSLINKGISPDNLINTKYLSDLDKTIIKKVLANISTMLSKLSYDFKGTM